jgi:hypothetical protein
MPVKPKPKKTADKPAPRKKAPAKRSTSTKKTKSQATASKDLARVRAQLAAAKKELAAVRKRTASVKKQVSAATKKRNALEREIARDFERLSKASTKARKRTTKAGKATLKTLTTAPLGLHVKQIGKGLGKAAKPKTPSQKRTLLERLGIKFRKGKLTPAKRSKIERLWESFKEFTGRARKRIVKFKVSDPALLKKAKAAGMLVDGNIVFVDPGRHGTNPHFSKLLRENVLVVTRGSRTYHTFLGGARTFNKIIKEFRGKTLPPGTNLTGAFFGGPAFNLVYRSAADLEHYLATMTPHMPAGVKLTKRNIDAQRRTLIRNLGVVTLSEQELNDARLREILDDARSDEDDEDED